MPRNYNYRIARKVAKQEIYKDNLKDHPLQWTDLIFDGGNVNTTPTRHSFVDEIRECVLEESTFLDWPEHRRNGNVSIYQGRIKIESINYQLRFQQDAENIESSNTFRWLIYSYVDTMDENNTPILQGASVDLPPNTEKVNKMYKDKIATLNVQSTGDFEGSITASPGTRIYKGIMKINKFFTMTHTEGDTNVRVDSGDVRWEAQSDTEGTGCQLYGFIRIYYRDLSR